jgi:hypothetical protein
MFFQLEARVAQPGVPGTAGFWLPGVEAPSAVIRLPSVLVLLRVSVPLW